MPSKYDTYWLTKLDEIKQLLKEAHENGRSGKINVSEIQNYGERGSWYGVVEVFEGGFRKGEMAHARSLGRTILNNGLLGPYARSEFRLVISTDLKLRVERLDIREKVNTTPNSLMRKRSTITSKAQNEICLRIHEIVESLPLYRYPINRENLPANGIYFFYEEGEKIQIGSQVKDRIVRVGTHREQDRFPDRIFNHYNGNKNSSVFRKHLGGALIRRKNPADSRLEQWLKQDAPTFDDVEGLVNAQLRERFSFRYIRVNNKEERRDLEKRLIATLSHCSQCKPSENWLGRFAASRKIQVSGLWNDQYVDSDDTMTLQHLLRLKKILGQTGSGAMGNDFSTKLEVRSEQIEKQNGQVICFFPCCARKCASGNIVGQGRSINQQDLPNTWNLLDQGRKGMRQYFNFSSPRTSAISLYIGAPYNSFQSHIPNIVQRILSGQLRVIIISAGYGIVDAFEPLHDYDAVMKGRVASHWRNSGLVNIVCDLLLTIKPSKVFGFFAGEVYWSTPASKYRYFFTEGLRMALNRGLTIKLGGCFYRKEGRGVQAILGALGRTFVDFMNSKFNTQFATNIQRNPRIDGNVTIDFERIP